MVSDVKYISMKTTYRHLKDFLADTTGIKAFPLVDNPGTNAGIVHPFQDLVHIVFKHFSLALFIRSLIEAYLAWAVLILKKSF